MKLGEELKMLLRNKNNPAQSPKAKELMRERIMKLGEAIKFAKPDLFELSEARKDLLCKRVLNSSTDTLIYFYNQITSELQDRDMRDYGTEIEWRKQNGYT